MALFTELKRRNVIRVGIAYVLMGWVLLQIADFALDLVDAPNWIIQTLSIIVLLGLPVALFFSWAFELTPEGVKREHEVDRSASITPQTGRRLDRVIIVVLLMAVGWLMADRLWLASQPVAEPGMEPAVVEVASDEGGDTKPFIDDGLDQKSIAVLPFISMSSGEDDGYFADGLTEEILNSLAQLPELLVTSRTSSFAMKGDDSPLEDIARRLRVDHVVEGSVRRSGDRLRITAQLIRADDGFHLWSNTYDSSSTDAIAVQEDIAEKIAGALNVVLDDDRRQSMRLAGLRDVDAYIAYQKGMERFNEAHGSEDLIEHLQAANVFFEEVLERVPDNAQAWSHHADLYSHQLINNASSQSIMNSADSTSAVALENLQHDLSRAIRHARSDEEEQAMRYDLAFVSGNWNRMDQRIESLIQHTGCEVADWADVLAYPYGYAERYLPREAKELQCDPLTFRKRLNLASGHIWAGQPEKAREVFAQVLPDERNEHYVVVKVFGELSAGDIDEAAATLEEISMTPSVDRIMRLMVAAARGDPEETAAARDAYLAEDDALKFRELVAHSVSGDRERANEIAARLDQHPQGYLALTLVVTYCVCSAPWDIEYTPNFQARLESSGLEWPPVDLIEFPLKTAAAAQP